MYSVPSWHEGATVQEACVQARKSVLHLLVGPRKELYMHACTRIEMQQVMFGLWQRQAAVQLMYAVGCMAVIILVM
jgi:hypothetical protein